MSNFNPPFHIKTLEEHVEENVELTDELKDMMLGQIQDQERRIIHLERTNGELIQSLQMIEGIGHNVQLLVNHFASGGNVNCGNGGNSGNSGNSGNGNAMFVDDDSVSSEYENEEELIAQNCKVLVRGKYYPVYMKNEQLYTMRPDGSLKVCSHFQLKHAIPL